MSRHREAGDRDRDRTARDLDDELAFHRQRTLDELRASGLDARAAEAEAERRFGPAAAYRRTIIRLDLRPERRHLLRTIAEVVAGSVRTVARDVRRTPGFTLGVIGILTLGLGVNAVTFGLVNRLVLSGPAAVHAPEDLRRVVVHRRSRQGAALATTDIGYLDYLDLRKSPLVGGAAAESRSPLLLGSGERAERIEARLVTAGYFPLLGVSPALGRFFNETESEAGARVAVLNHAYWQRRFGGAASVIGQIVPIGSHRYTVVGIAPKEFTGATVDRVDVFLPLEAAADELVSGPWRTSRNFNWMQAVVRVMPDGSDAAAADAITATYRQGYAEVKDADPDARLELAPIHALRGVTATNETSVAALVGAVAGLVLVIAIANASNLFLARSLRQRDRLAVRLALGGSRGRLIAEHATEGALLALAGAAVAVWVAGAGAAGVQQLLFPSVAWTEAAIDLRAAMALAACAVLGGALAAALPMWNAGRTDVAGWLRVGAGRSSRRRTRLQSSMIVVQGTLSVILLVAAGLFVRSLSKVEALDLGLDADRLLVVAAVTGDTPVDPHFADQLRARIATIPGVAATTRVSGTFPFVSSWATRLTVAGLADRPRVEDGGPYIHAVEPGYFQTVGTSIAEGRPFTTDDRLGAPRVVIVNRSMARLYWPGQTALGKCLHIGPDTPPCSVVVGVAENTRRQEIIEGDSLLYYVPIEQAEDNLRAGGRLVIRTVDSRSETVGRIAEVIRRQALEIAPTLRFVAARPLDDIVSPQLRIWRLGASLFSAFGVLALAVATIGLYTVVAFDVEGRRREMALRAALGATAPSLRGLVVRDGLRITGLGIGIGLAVAWVLSPLVSTLLFDTGPQDMGVYSSVALTLAVAAIGASFVPGLRASSVDPSAALRDE